MLADPRWFRSLAGVLMLALALPALAQIDPTGDDEVEIRLEKLGVGGAYREGELTGFRFALTDRADEPRTVALRLHLRDADGDTTVYQRVVTLTPDQALGTWIYARLPFRVPPVFDVTAHEATVRSNGTFSIGRQVGARRFPRDTGTPHPASKSLIGVIGTRTLGLDQYTRLFGNNDHSLTSHEVSGLVSGIVASPNELPDLWKGWAAFEAIIWSGGDPLSIGPDAQANAIAEWVRRGGHLVIVLPAIGNNWFLPSNPLRELMPDAEVIRREDTSLEPFRHLLTSQERHDAEFPRSNVLYEFVPNESMTVGNAVPLFAGPDGSVVVVRKLLGTGMVTVVGLNINNRTLAAQGVPSADAFWHRILGKRFDVLTGDQTTQWGQKSGFALSNSPIWTDRRIASAIAKEEDAGFGILMGLVIFIAYWLVAGPLGFAILKKAGYVRHAWLVFVGSTLAFTLVAWASANTFRLKGTGADHLTIIDHVWGQPVQSAAVWASVFLPTYGEQEITVGDPEDDARWHQAITPWIDPTGDGAGTFPDARPYFVDVRDAQSITVPARSTIKQFRADWLGSPTWSTPTPSGPDGSPRLEADASLSGFLRHDLPAPLQRVRVVLITGQLPQDQMLRLRRDRSKQSEGMLRAVAHSWSLASNPDAWAPGTELDLSQFTKSPGSRAAAYLGETKLVPRTGTFGFVPEDLAAGQPQDFERLSFYGVLQPPVYDRGPGESRTSRLARKQGHSLDLAKWFTQPCLIIYGELEDAPSPVPLFVDGRPCPTNGRTIFRWIYPLQADPVRFSPAPHPEFPKSNQPDAS